MFFNIGTVVIAAEVGSTRRAADVFEYSLSQREIDALESKLTRLSKGISLNDVTLLLGRPASDGNIYRKRIFGKSQFVGYQIVYVLKKVRVNDNNVRDHTISILFDEHGKLKRANRRGYSKTSSFKIIGGVQIVEVIIE
jgi:outer membrane protein assembly factor BamE (lipoprotein component of BamABCDE complex)